jgi:hypothetical protein
MLRPSLLTALFCVLLTCATASAQGLCPVGTASDKLVCLIPGVYGPNGLALDANGHQGHFEESFLVDRLTPLDSAVGSQSSRLPLASPSAGITFTWNPTAKVFTTSTDSFGPVLGERAETIGRYRLFLGFSYQYFKFDSLDGLDLKKLPAVYTHKNDSVDVAGRTCSINGDNTGACGFVRDVVKTNNRIDLRIHQFTTFVTFGLTNRIDVSMAIPIENVRMGVFSNATIVNNSLSGDHIFPPRPDCVAPCLDKLFSNVRNVSGIGDITLRVKGTAWKGERAGVALGVDVRVPTGDKLNFLGSGAAGVRPFVVWSYRSRISPHVVVGYETNGSSVLAGDILTGSKERLPSQLTYSGGADVWLTKWFTAAFDLIGQQVFEARRVSTTTFTELGACTDPTCTAPFKTPNMDPNLSQLTASYNITNASIGAKIRPLARLLVTGNVLIKLNDGGLRARFVPLVAVSYTF